MTRTQLRFRSGLCAIIHVCLSISAQLWYKIKLVSFWVHLNARPSCVIVENPSWPSVFLYTTTNNASGRIVLFIKSSKPDYMASQLVMGVYYIIYSPKLFNVTLCISHLKMSWFLDGF